MIPKKLAPFLYSLTLSGIMSLVVTAIATAKVIGPDQEFVPEWLGAWSLSWPIAFAVAFSVAPYLRRFIDNNTRS